MAWHGITDGKDRVNISPDGSIPVTKQDSYEDIVDLYVCRSLGFITLATDTALDDTVLNFTAGHGVLTGEVLCFNEAHRYTQVIVTGVNVNAVTIDSPLDYAYSTSATVFHSEHDLTSITASRTAPVIHRISPPPGTSWDITRMLFFITSSTVMDSAKFGGIPALTNGVVIRKKDGIRKNIFNVKSNSDFAERAYDLEYDDKAPSGVYGMRCRRSFNGDDKNGVVIRLNGEDDEEFQVIIQDDLTALKHFHIIVQGHVVQYE